MYHYMMLSLLIFLTIIHSYLTELILIPIKSHKILTESIRTNQISSIYDNDADTKGSFYSLKDKSAEVEFDLGNNFLIDNVILRMKKEDVNHNPIIHVGNSFNDQGQLKYNCEISKESEDFYICQPVCRSSTVYSPGIIARKIILTLNVSSKWISVYEIEVFSRLVTNLDDISSNRLVLPSECSKRSWLLTNSTTDLSIPTNQSIDVYFEKSYIITQLTIKFSPASLKSFDILLTSDRNKKKTVTISLSDCSLLHSLFTCTLSEKTFPVRHLNIATPGLEKLFIKGKTVFYPQLEITTSIHVNKKLLMTCDYSDCDLSVHGDCSESAKMAGVTFECVNKRLIRMASAGDKDSYVIVNQGEVAKVWRSTNFSVDKHDRSSMVVSMPRSYQYFGQYQCGCIIADEFNTEIMSKATQLKETDFLEKLIFDKLFQYKLSESDTTFQNISNNILLQSKSKVFSPYIPFQINLYSLMQSNRIIATYDVGDKESEIWTTDKGSLHSIKAFGDISQSWSVATYQYVSDELFPEFSHERNISIMCESLNGHLSQRDTIMLLERDLLVKKPAIWSNDGDSKIISMNIMYANANRANIFYRGTVCSGSKYIMLATLSNDICQSTDRRLICTDFKGATLATFSEEWNFAKTVVMELVDTVTNKSVASITSKSNVVLSQEDIVIKFQYINLRRKSINEDSSLVTIQINILSKKINDFLPCGTVVVKVVIPNQDKKEMILQKPVFTIDLEMTTSIINVLVNVTIENVRGSHVTQLKIVDPTTFSADKVAFQQDKSLSLVWDGIDNIASKLLQFYEVTVNHTVVACDQTVTNSYNVSKIEMPRTSRNRYSNPMPTVSRKHKVKLSVSVQPVYMGNIRGRLVKYRKEFGTISQSDVIIKHSDWRTELPLTVVASQSEIPCDIKNTEFNVTGINVEKFQWTSVSLGNLLYKIKNLVPGRKYKLTAKVLYKIGLEDLTSKSYTFETADDVSILTERHVANINDFVNITCVAAIGPDDKFKKSVQWLRSDRSLLPDGVMSVRSRIDENVAYLVMEKASADHSGEYSCFAQPSAAIGWMTISIVVNDLVIFPNSKKVDFEKKSDNIVTVTCSSSAVGENNLQWLDPSGAIITGHGLSGYSIKKLVTDQNVHKSILSINSLSLNVSGTYKCRKAIGNNGATKEFFLYGNEKISIEPLKNSSYFVGEKQRLRCSAKLGLFSQTVMWDIITMDTKEVTLMNTSYPISSDRTMQDIELLNTLSIHKVTCRLHPMIFDHVTTSYNIRLESKVVVKGPTKVDSGTNVTLTCLGYPDKSDMQLEWIFYSNNKTSVGKEVLNSGKTSTSKPYEPLRLDLNITDVKNTEAGRYACNFKQKAMARIAQPSHSIDLVVNSVNQFLPDNAKKDTRTSFSNNCPITFLATVISFIVVHNRYV